MTRETIIAVARRHGLVASFLPIVFDGEVGSGGHMHFSIIQVGTSTVVGLSMAGTLPKQSSWLEEHCKVKVTNLDEEKSML